MKNYTLFGKVAFALPLLVLCLNLEARELAAPKQQSQTLTFIENKGQITDQFRHKRTDLDFKVPGNGMNIFIGDGAIHYQWNKVENEIRMDMNQNPAQAKKQLIEDLKKPVKVTSYRMDVSLAGANKNALLVKDEEQGYYETYYLHQFDKNGAKAHSYNRVTYKNIYPNIDWVLYTSNGSLKYDFIVHPGGDPSDIKIKYEGATNIALSDGAITAATPYGTITEQKPYSYDAMSKREVASRFVLQDNILSFDIASFDGTLVIDPSLNWATYYGGSNGEYAYGLTADPSGNVFMAGWTNSTNNIATTGAYQTSLYNSTQDGFLAKFTAGGSRLWGTYYGDANSDWFWSADVDPSGNVYAAGYTQSTNGIATTGAHQTTLGGNVDAMLVKFTTNGARIWATYYGGSNTENQGNVTCDASGNVYLNGETWSTNAIATTGAYQTTLNSTSTYDAFLVKFNSSGVRQWGTYFGGNGQEDSWGSDCDASGNVYISGWTTSTSGIATSGAYQTTHAGSSTWDGYFSKFDASGNLLWSTYYGGTGTDVVYDISCDGLSNVYVSGYTFSTSGIATTGAYQTTLSGTYDGFIVKFSPGGSIQWGTYYGGPSNDYTWGLAATLGGYIYVTGWTQSTTGIATTGAYQTTLGGATDAFLLEMNSTTGTPTWCTYFGGTGTEWGYGHCAWSQAGYVYMSGYTSSTNAIATPNAHQTTMGGGSYDAFLASFIADTIVYIKQPYIDTVFCPGDTFKLAYGVTYSFKSGNVFTAQLSNATGSFATPVNIGTKTATTADTIICVIPPSAAAGSGYRVRIVASNPVRTSFDNNVDIRVKPLPQNLLASSNSPVCVGNTLSLSATTTTTTLVTYTWTGPGSYTSGQQNPSINNVQTSHAGDYIVTANSQGCIAKDTFSVVVNIIPATPTVSSNSPVCPTTTLNLTSSSTTPGVTYSWTGPASFTSSQQNPTITNVNSSHAGVYSVTAAKNGCVSPAATTTVAVYVTTPTPVAGGNNILCGGATLNLTASTIPGATYQWTGPAGFTSTQQNPVISPAQAYHSGPYIVRATLNGCISEPDTIVVSVNIVSTIGGWASPNDTICDGTLVTFVAVQTNGGPTPVYQWYKNYVAIPGANNLLYTTSSVSDGDVFYCTMYSVGVCTDPILVSTDSMKLTVLNITTTPSAHIVSTPSQPQPGQSVSFFASVANGGYQPTYQWQRNGQNVFGAIYANWSANNLNPYDKINCIVTSSDPCATPKVAYTDTVVIGFPTGISGLNNSGKQFSLYPNPNNGSFTLSGTAHNETINLEVLNTIGQVVYTNNLPTGNKYFEIPVRISGLAAGTYLLKVKDGEGLTALPFTVGH